MKIKLLTEVPNPVKGRPPYPKDTMLDVLPGMGKKLVKEGKAVALGKQLWPTDREAVQQMAMAAEEEE